MDHVTLLHSLFILGSCISFKPLVGGLEEWGIEIQTGIESVPYVGPIGCIVLSVEKYAC